MAIIQVNLSFLKFIKTFDNSKIKPQDSHYLTTYLFRVEKR